MPDTWITEGWRFTAAIYGDRDARIDLASMVYENASEISDLVREAQKQLRDLTRGDASFDAYASLPVNPERLHQQVEAIFTTLQRFRPVAAPRLLSYGLEKLHPVEGIQAVRPAPLVFQEGRGNCLDWTLLLAGCLYSVSIRPLILVTSGGGHAMLGYWLEEPRQAGANPLVPVDDLPGRIAIVESTLIPPGNRGVLAGFSKAHEPSLAGGAERVLFAVDVHAARRNGVLPRGLGTKVLGNLGNMPPPAELTGRAEDLRQLNDLLFSRGHMVVVEGLPGVGKTRLVREAVQRLLAANLGFDVIAWIRCDPSPPSLGDLFTILARDVFDSPDMASLPEPERQRQVEALLLAHHALLVFDAFQYVTDPQLRDYLAYRLPATAKAILTSNKSLAGLPSYPMTLKGVGREDARWLVLRRSRLQPSDFPAGAFDKIFRVTGGLPLALLLVAGQLAAGKQVATVLHELEDDRRSEELFSVILTRAWDGLEQAARKVFLAAALFPYPVSARTLGECAAVGGRFAGALETLLRCFLIAPVRGKGGMALYAINHSLVRGFAAGKLNTWRTRQSMRAAARTSLLTLIKDSYQDLSAGYERLREQAGNILHMLEECYAGGEYSTLLDYLEYVSYFLYDICYWIERQKWAAAGYRVALKLAAEGDTREYYRAGKCAYWEGWYHCRFGNYRAAERAAERAAKAFARSGVSYQEPRVNQLRGLIAFGRRQYAKASTHVQAALRRFRLERGSAGRAARADKDYWISIMHVTLGNIAVVRGDESLDAGRKTAAFRHYQTALAWYRQVKADSQLHTRRHTPGSGYCDRWDARLARTYGNLGELYYRLGDRHAALRHFQEGYDRARSLGLPNTLGACLLGRGLLMWEDDPVEAAGLLRQGLQEIDRLGKPPLMGKRLIEQARSLLDLTRVAVNQARAGG